LARTEPRPPAQRLEGDDPRLAAAIAGFHRGLAERLLAGARARLAEAGLPEDRLDEHWVPGSFELPLAARTLAETGRYAAVIALGVVIRGETPHFQYVCDVAASGLSRVALDTGVPCAFGVLTTDTLAQAEARAGGEVGNAGRDAADAAVAMVNLIARVRGA
jgi:6,7-dimethyl-8-ribityllumazine synthase